MAVGADHGASAGPLSEAEVHVKELEELEDYYFETDRHSKMAATADKVAKCVDRALEALRPPPKDLNAQGLFLKGRALSFLPGQESKAEELLSKAIKLEPKLLSAWNALGELHWNVQNYQRSRECFEHALEFCGANSVSLRGISMVLRAVDNEAAADDDDAVSSRRCSNFATALEKAKAAVALDASDPQNWETLGNAYVGDFFVNARRPDELSRALIAYGKAETFYAKLGKGNPSLQLNRGMAAKYIEDYDLALRSFRKAQEIGSPNAAKEGQKVMELVQKLSGYAQRKGDLKAKHLKELLEDMTQGAEGQRSLRDLRANAGSSDAPLVVKVVNIVDRQDELPMIILCCDAFGDFFALSMYNAQPSKVADAVVPMKTLLHIRQPRFREVVMNANHKTWSYPCVRVGHPGDISIAGGGSLEAAAVLSKFSAAAQPREPHAGSAHGAREGRSESAPPPAQKEREPLSLVDPKQERWIDEEDAKIKKEEAKAKAKAKAKVRATKGKSQKKDRTTAKDIAKKGELEDVSTVGKVNTIDIDADLETNTGSGSSSEKEEDGKENVEDVEDPEDTPEKALQKVRWSDLDDSDSDVPREVSSRIRNAQQLPLTV